MTCMNTDNVVIKSQWLLTTKIPCAAASQSFYLPPRLVRTLGKTNTEDDNICTYLPWNALNVVNYLME